MPQVKNELLGSIMSNVSHDLFQDGLVTGSPFAMLICYTNPVKSPPWDFSVILNRAGNSLYGLYTLHLTISSPSYSYGDWRTVPSICCNSVDTEEMLRP